MDIELIEIQNVLKRIIKKKNLTYKDVARSMSMSESGIKKLLTSADMSFQRIKGLCDSLQVNLTDVLDEAGQKEIREERFSDTQEQYFLKNLDSFYFFWKLVVEREPVDKIQQEQALTKAQITRYLTKLDRLNLIELHSDNRIKFPKRESKRWVGKGPLTKKIQNDWGLRLWKDSIKDYFKDAHQSELFIRHLKLSPNSYEELKLALRELEKEFVSRSTREQSLQSENLKTFRLMAATSLGSFISRIN